MNQRPDWLRRAALTGLAAAVFTVVLSVSGGARPQSVAAMAPAEPKVLRPVRGGGTVYAHLPDRVIPMGCAVGIKLFADGVLVVGLAPEDSPARTMGLRPGDVITHVNANEVDTIEQMQKLLDTLAGQQLSLRVDRDGEELTLTGTARTEGDWKLGAWIRDSMAGIGTMTFYDPASGRFGALGHGINDVDTARLMPLESGSIMPASVTEVKKGEKGTPGQLHGSFDVQRDVGLLYANTGAGVFGQLSDPKLLGSAKPVALAPCEQVHVGPAAILSNVDGQAVDEYRVEIRKIYPASEGERRNLMVEVTDPRLLERTGGIVQGMSGSPILQDGKLVGAVTHVLVNDPTRGYGIFIENMLDAAG